MESSKKKYATAYSDEDIDINYIEEIDNNQEEINNHEINIINSITQKDNKINIVNKITDTNSNTKIINLNNKQKYNKDRIKTKLIQSKDKNLDINLKDNKIAILGDSLFYKEYEYHKY